MTIRKVFMVDNILLNDLIEYNVYRKSCFKNGIVPIFEDKKLESILSARYQKCGRVKQHLVWLFHRYNYLFFLTFTFDDDYIKKSDRTKRDLIKNCLRSFCEDISFIMNIDYGKNTEREHFHVICGFNCEDDFFKHIKDTYPCFTWIDKINLDNADDILKISKYINKLSNHCIKKSTRNNRIFFSFKGYGDMSVPEVKKEYILDKSCIGL